MKLFIILLLVPVVAFFTLYFLGSRSFGSRPGEDYQTIFESSVHYDKEKKIFVNRRPKLVAEMRKRTFTPKLIFNFFKKGVDRSPLAQLPEVKPDLQEFLKPSPDLKVIWFGHSSFLLNYDGKIILVDPVFSGSAAPLGFMVKRFQKPVVELSELPAIDYVVLSHDHYDHLDKTSIEFFQDKKAKFLTPLGVGAYLVGWGIDKSRITELDWWQSYKADDIEFISTPAQHFSGRDGLHDNQTLWGSWVIRNQKHNIYFSGDSGYDIHFKEIGDKYGPFDLAFMEVGQYNEMWKEVHMLPEEAAQAYFDLSAKRFFPVHWGMFVLALHTWYDPIERITQLAENKGINLVSPQLGEVVMINDSFKSKSWWKNISKSRVEKN